MGCWQGSPEPRTFDRHGFFSSATVAWCRGMALAARSRLYRLEKSAVRVQILLCSCACGRVHAERRFGACARAVRVGCRSYGRSSRGCAWGGRVQSQSST